MKRCLLLFLMLCLLAPSALAYDAQTVEVWLEGFASAAQALSMLNDPLETADPARPGEYLIEYEFGTVLSLSPSTPAAGEIIEIDVRTEQVTDCRGVRVGMPLSSALDGARIAASETSLAVLSTQDAGLGWSWAYVGDAGVYGVEYITYGGEGVDMREYTLTYMIGEDEMISGIRVRIAQATQAQAEDGMRTAEEIASRQQGEVLAFASDASMLEEGDLCVMGTACLNAPVADFVAVIGEPVEIQVLPGGNGRLLLYEGAVLTLTFDEHTGEELVTSVSVSGTGVNGPRGLSVGDSVQEAAALFRCDADVTGLGGTRYLEGEAEGDAPYGVLQVQPGWQLLRYGCLTSGGETALLDIGIRDGAVAYWIMHTGEEEMQDDG